MTEIPAANLVAFGVMLALAQIMFAASGAALVYRLGVAVRRRLYR